MSQLLILHGSVVKCRACDLRAPGSSMKGCTGVFVKSVLQQDTSKPQPSTGERKAPAQNWESQAIHDCVLHWSVLEQDTSEP